MTVSVPAWTAVIPLRGGSKGLPGKNTRLLAGKPLYRHAVDQALSAGATRVLISTDIPEVQGAVLPVGVEVLSRPAELAGDATPMASVLLHAIQAAGVTGVVGLLQATSPLRQTADILAALVTYATGMYELVMSVTGADRGVLKWGTLLDDNTFIPLVRPEYCFSNRQSLPPVFRPNGAVYVFDAQAFVQRGNLAFDRIGSVHMSAERSLDIDTLEDFERCEQRLLSTMSSI